MFIFWKFISFNMDVENSIVLCDVFVKEYIYPLCIYFTSMYIRTVRTYVCSKHMGTISLFPLDHPMHCAMLISVFLFFFLVFLSSVFFQMGISFTSWLFTFFRNFDVGIIQWR